MPLDAEIESILFWKGEAISLKKIASILNKTEEEIKTGLTELDQKLVGRGLQLVYKEDEVMLGTRNEMSSIIEGLTKEELVRDLGKAGLETLAIILYRGPVYRRDIDYIRGVNSNFILRNLLVRGLIEKVHAPHDQRSFMYKPTFELLTHLGISKLEDLPSYLDVRAQVENHEKAKEETEEKQEVIQQSHESTK
ncbi:MAG: SMC-Scp complex subunit ScpB [bacterium]|nr:SMC-Scp complex subunit ScpB [bacterium]